jgi:hypothetical protein
MVIIITHFGLVGTYDHRKLKTGIPVRSSLLKQLTGGLVVRWVTTSESPLSYVYVFFWHFECMSRGQCLAFDNPVLGSDVASYKCEGETQ